MFSKFLPTTLLVFALAGIAHAKPELATPIMRTELSDQVVCYANNVGKKDVTIKMQVYKDGILRGSSGNRVLAANERFSLGVGDGTFWWQCKIVVVKGAKKSVRGIMYGSPPSDGRPVVSVEAR